MEIVKILTFSSLFDPLLCYIDNNGIRCKYILPVNIYNNIFVMNAPLVLWPSHLSLGLRRLLLQIENSQHAQKDIVIPKLPA